MLRLVLVTIGSLALAACGRPSSPPANEAAPWDRCPPTRAEAAGQDCVLGLSCDYEQMRCSCDARPSYCGNEACEEANAERVAQSPMPEPGGFTCEDGRCPSDPPEVGSPCEPLATPCRLASGDLALCREGQWSIEPQPEPM